MTFEIFGLELSLGWYIVLFFVCQFINVALNTIKTIVMHKEEKVSSSLINAITYGFYAIIVVMTASALDLWITIVITIITNLIGVYVSMLVLEKLKKDSLWEIVATLKFEKEKVARFAESLTDIGVSFNMVDNWNKTETILHIYSKTQSESAKIKTLLDLYGAKYIVHEEKVKLM